MPPETFAFEMGVRSQFRTTMPPETFALNEIGL